ncbi:MAG: bifunctional phosphoribosylaminoimidazolecarboxamide formyltransferase/IMP cyclohydrolase [Planctomycetia bacterium]|nr:MAG: bifunctional phosphoribosylaminoimidazolecarboxamide formyltransferase/IMP cyclohydrolase [Planctomycetia bacterium]
MSPRIERALISVSDKEGLACFAKGLVAAGVQVYSTGGTGRHLQSEGIEVVDISAYTGFPELMDGRLKTLHPAVHGGILCRRDRPDDMAALRQHGILPFELVVVNLYPFEATVARPGVSSAEAIEQIDIGGPTLIRAAAKNHAYVTVATERSQYGPILDEIKTAAATSPELRRRLAVAAFARTSQYDQAIDQFLLQQTPADTFPENLSLRLHRKTVLRYGENPHQAAALYTTDDRRAGSLVEAKQLNGKELSYNNLLDLNSAWALVRQLPAPAVVVLKHNNPCGAAVAASLQEALRRAWAGDPMSAFGSVLGMNQAVDRDTAEALCQPNQFVEAIVAPEFQPEALEILTTKPKWKTNVRLLAVADADRGASRRRELRAIDGGLLVQEADDDDDPQQAWQDVTERKPTESQRNDLRFAWSVCRHVRSNAIVLGKNQAVVGVGAGQMSRVDAVELAIAKAGDRAQGSVLASDAFFPFADSIHRAAETGVVAVIQPGGSRRDAEVIAACNEHDLPMIFAGRRHFRH